MKILFLFLAGIFLVINLSGCSSLGTHSHDDVEYFRQMKEDRERYGAGRMRFKTGSGGTIAVGTSRREE
jgi:hypothetical protein